MGSITLHEASRYSILINKPTQLAMSWGNSPLTIQTDKGLDVFEFTNNVVDYSRSIQFNVRSITYPNHVPCERFFKTKLFKKELSNQEYLHYYFDPNLWAQDATIAKKVTRLYKHYWLEHENPLDKNNTLVTLTNSGSIDFYKRNRLEFKPIFNLTTILENKIYENSIRSDFCNPESVSKVCKNILSTSICSGSINSDDNKYFVTSQRSGSIIFWILNYNEENELFGEICEEIQFENEEIVNLLWISLQDTVFLVCSFLNGVVTGYECEVNNKKVKILKEILLWKFKDKMPTQFVKFKKVDDKILLIYSKHRHIVIHLLDSKRYVLDTLVKNIDDYKIVGLIEIYNNFVVGTYNCQLYLLNVSISSCKIMLNDIKIEIISSHVKNHLLEAFNVSQNKVLWSFIVTNRKLDTRKIGKEISVLFLFDKNVNVIDLLNNNPMKCLRNMSDCMELLKFKSNKFRMLPQIDYNLFYKETNDSVYKLKIYLMILMLYHNRLYFSTKREKYIFPETSVEKVKDKIFLKHSLNLINNIQSIYKEDKSLTISLQQVYYGCKQNIIQYCHKYKKNIESLFIDNIEVDSIHYTCQCCDELLNGFTCRNNHLNQFCSVTFTPISDDKYLECPYCGLTARYDLLPENPTCTLCDSFLTDCFLPT